VCVALPVWTRFVKGNNFTLSSKSSVLVYFCLPGAQVTSKEVRDQILPRSDESCSIVPEMLGQAPELPLASHAFASQVRESSTRSRIQWHILNISANRDLIPDRRRARSQRNRAGAHPDLVNVPFRGDPSIDSEARQLVVMPNQRAVEL